jgi:hypothetical protein
MAGTPTSPPLEEGLPSERANTDAQAWERPVPTRWAPSPDSVAQTVPANTEVMNTAPGEAPVSR